MKKEINHPSFQKLHKIAKKASEVIDADESNVFEAIGLIFTDELERYSELYTPLNSATFAHTGGDGVHFSLIETVGIINEESPVVMTVPWNYEKQQLIVGENLVDFLSLGCVTGFFFLDELSYKGTDYLDLIFDFDKHLHSIYFDNDAIEDDKDDIEDMKSLLEYLTKWMNLEPWRNPKEKFINLQNQYQKILVIPKINT